MTKVKVFKYKPFKKIVTVLQPKGGKVTEKEVIVKDAYILVKENGDSIVGDSKMLQRYGFNVTDAKDDYKFDSTESKIVEKVEKTEQVLDKDLIKVTNDSKGN